MKKNFLNKVAALTMTVYGGDHGSAGHAGSGKSSDNNCTKSTVVSM